MEVAHLSIGQLAHPLDEEEDNSLQDQDNEKNDDDLWQFESEECYDVRAPVIFDEFDERLVLQGHGQKEHDYCVSLSVRDAVEQIA
jgi:hypothetical protein